MKCSIPLNSLKEAFAAVKPAVPTRTPMPVLMNVLLSTSGDECWIEANANEVGIAYRVPGVQVHADGNVLINADKLGNLIRCATEEWVSFETTKTGVKVAAGGKWTIETVAVADFPRVRPSAGTATESAFKAVVSGPDFAELVRKTSFSVDAESSRWALAGLCIEVDGNDVRFVSTDGRQLSTLVVSAAPGSQLADDVPLLIPAELAAKLSKSVAILQEANLSSNGRSLFVQGDCLFATCKLLEGRFPRWRDSVGGTAEAEFQVGVKSLLAAVRQAKIGTEAELCAVHFHAKDGLLKLSARAHEAVATLAISFAGDASADIDPARLEVPLALLDGESLVTVIIQDDGRPLSLKQGNFQYWLMPLERS